MVTVPDATPVTTPLLVTVATEGLLLLQLPPAVPFVVNVIVALTHREEAPLIVPALEDALTVTDLVALDTLHPLTV